jgi:hypothetical protein
MLLAKLTNGAIFGEMALLARAPRAASVTAMRPSIVIEVKRDSLEEIVSDYPEVATELANHCRERMFENLLRASDLLSVVPDSQRPVLVERFCAEFSNGPGLSRKTFMAEALTALAARDWPGNVRELRNAVERLMILSPADAVTGADVERLGGAASNTAVGELVYCETFEAFKQQAERAFLTAKLAENGWNVSETARKLDMPRSNLYKKIERYGLQRES